MRTPTTPTEARTASADTLLQLIAWVDDRRAYRAACHIVDRAATVADDSAQDIARQELHRRGLI